MKLKIAAVTLFFPVSVMAEFLDGNQLLARMNGTALDQAVATGYVMGVFDAHQNVSHCAPDRITNIDLTKAMKIYLEHSSTRNMLASADMLLSAAFEAMWPCNSKSRI